EDRIADYEDGVRRFAGLASYLTINISSPNTVGLRSLQERESLAELLTRVMQARDSQAKGLGPSTPVFLKIAPDLNEQALEDIAAEVLDKRIDGVIVSNTTLSRDGLKSAEAKEAGGLSGAPLFERSTIVQAKMRRLIGPWLPIIGAGGVDSAETALEKIRAGADLVQLYTSLIYGGPQLPGRILRDMDKQLLTLGVSSVTELRDTRLADWANRPLNRSCSRRTCAGFAPAQAPPGSIPRRSGTRATKAIAPCCPACRPARACRLHRRPGKAASCCACRATRLHR